MSRHSYLYCAPYATLEFWTYALCPEHKEALRALFPEASRVRYTYQARVACRGAMGVLGIGPGDEILAPALNCGTEIDALIESGATVICYDATPSLGVDMDDLLKRITARTRAIYVTHYFGFPTDLSQVLTLCKDRGLHLVEDCALALYSSGPMGRLGTLGDIAVYNFPKLLPVPAGGALLINNPDLPDWQPDSSPSARTLIGHAYRMIRHSMLQVTGSGPLHAAVSAAFKSTMAVKQTLSRRSQSLAEEQEPSPGGRADIPAEYYFSPAAAGMAASSITRRVISHLDHQRIVRQHRQNYQRIEAGIAGIPGISPAIPGLPDGVCPLNFPVIVQNRDRLWEQLQAAGIHVSNWWPGFHRDVPWDDYPQAVRLKDHLMTFPIHEDLTPRHLDYICETVRDLAEYAQ